MRSNRSIFTEFICLLGVKNTARYSEQKYNEHPNKNNLLGLSTMLSDYGIENAALRVKEDDRENTLSQIEAPFVAYVGNDFALVRKIAKGFIHYLWKGKETVLEEKSFIEAWSGVVLVAEPNDQSIEPDYAEHHRQELITQAKKTVLTGATIMLLGISYLESHLYDNIGLSIALMISFLGAWICYLLVLKQMHQQSSYADKICSLFLHQSDCNDVLESDASKLLGIFSWSEIGLGYFCANIVMILFLPSLFPYVALLNIVALPYTVWSVWYQKSIAKQWCPLCLLIQAILWAFFINNLLFGLIQWPDITVVSLLVTGSIYAIPILGLNLLLSKLADSIKLEQVKQEMNSLKADEMIFQSLLNTKVKYSVEDASSIIWGNPEAKNLITVVTNPHCNPCAKMHQRLVQLLSDTQNGFRIQYVLTSFSEELDKSTKFFIAMYQQLDLTNFDLFMNDWYTDGKNRREYFYKEYPFDCDDNQLLLEFNKLNVWLESTKIMATPTVLFNGYELPEQYKVEDLEYFIRN